MLTELQSKLSFLADLNALYNKHNLCIGSDSDGDLYIDPCLSGRYILENHCITWKELKNDQNN